MEEFALNFGEFGEIFQTVVFLNWRKENTR